MAITIASWWRRHKHRQLLSAPGWCEQWLGDPPQSRHHKRIGPIRNQAMADTGADMCVAFILPGSVGTLDCARRARLAGIPVIRYYLT